MCLFLQTHRNFYILSNRYWCCGKKTKKQKNNPLDRRYIYSLVAVSVRKNLCLLFGIVPGSTAQAYGCGQCCQILAFSRWIVIFQKRFENSVCP